MEEIVEVAKLKIRIKKCSFPKFWYSNIIGEEISVINFSSRDYCVGYKGKILYILVVDADII